MPQNNPAPEMGVQVREGLQFRPAETLADRILKVDHAGEHGAVNIYRGQILVSRWRAKRLVPHLEDFLRHEKNHRAIFEREMSERGVRRCRSFGLCGLGGYVLGVVTGLLGPSAVGSTTAAVEKVVLRHLTEQLTYLAETDRNAFEAVSAIVADEKAHHDWGRAASEQSAFWTAILEPIVAVSTESVIWLGMRL